MSIQHTLASNEAVVLAPGGGQRFSFLDNLATVKVAAGSARSMSVVEFLAPYGFGPPQHRHNEEDELFIVLEGELTFFLGDDRFPGAQGSLAYLPRAVPHTFQVVSDGARIINVTTSTSGLPRFDQMVAALGEPTERDGLPEPSPIDPGRVAEVCAVHGIDIVGPPPASL